MSQDRFQSPKGTQDIVPPESAVWAQLEATARTVFSLHGFQEIRTPIFEDTALFQRGVGESSDIVGKEMYTFEDKAGRSLTLRPESTAAVCRAFIQHGMHRLPQPVKLFYIGPQFRFERPQSGRFRQFHQIGVELLSRPNDSTTGAVVADQWFADVEVISVLHAFLRKLGFDDLCVRVNTVGDEETRTSFRAGLVNYLSGIEEMLSEDSQRRLKTNPLRILDSKDPQDHQALAGAPRLSSFLTRRSLNHFDGVRSELSSLGIPFETDERLVRGLDYYTNTVFEVISKSLGAQNAICGGGAYEGLVEELGGPRTYGVGFAIGEERLLAALPKSTTSALRRTMPVLVSVLPISSQYGPGYDFSFGVKLTSRLRFHGIPAEWTAGKPERAFRRAEQLGSEFVLFAGENELNRTNVVLRDLKTRSQEELDLQEAIEKLRRHFKVEPDEQF